MCNEVSEDLWCQECLDQIELKAWIQQCEVAFVADAVCLDREKDATALFLDNEACIRCTPLDGNPDGG